MLTTISTYDELGKWAVAFASNTLDLVVLEGNPGIGKSSMVRQVMGSTVHWIEGRISPVCLFDRLRDNVDLPIVLDDTDGLFRERESISLVKSLCQTEYIKRVTWATRTNRGNSQSFETTSKVMLITNDTKSLIKNIGAIEDRGIVVHFRPSNIEIYQYARGILGENFDVEIYDYIGERIDDILQLSLRMFVISKKLKSLGMDWRSTLLASYGLSEDERIYLDVSRLSDLSENAKAKLFAERSGRTERTFWRLKRKLS